MIPYKDAAVSPVVGVMLMLVVTIIIAAVVSAFSGSLASEQHKTPQTSISARSIIQGFGGSEQYNGFLFENTGGDTFALNDIAVQLQTQDTKYTLTAADKVNWSDSAVCLPSGITYNGGYFQKVGNTSAIDITIAPGDKFMLYADQSSPATSYAGYGDFAAAIKWKPVGVQGGFSVYQNTKVQYKIIDKASSRVISSGEVFLA